MSDTVHDHGNRYVPGWLSTMRPALIDYATIAFAFMSVACGPLVVWLLVWMAAR